MKVLAILNPENGTCKDTLSLLKDLSDKGFEISKVILALENTYHAEKWIISLSMPLSKTDIEKLKERYMKKILSEWEALTGEKGGLNIIADADAAKNIVKQLKEEYDILVLGCLEHKSLCKLIENLDKPILVIKN
jgi:hypothetical protein